MDAVHGPQVESFILPMVYKVVVETDLKFVTQCSSKAFMESKFHFLTRSILFTKVIAWSHG